MASRSSRPARRRPRVAAAFAAFLIGAAKIAGAAILLGLIALGVSVAIAMGSLPSFDEFRKSPNGQSVEIRAADNSVLVSLGPSYGEWLPFARIPHTMTAAMIAVEDRRFYSHPGVDPIGIARSLAVAERSGHFTQGASTITQQLARNVFLTSNRTFSRKLREVVLSLAIERKFTKDAILELYLNRVYFGGGAYGIDAASRKFFGHPASTLSLPEAAIIAGLVKAPSRYAPSADPIAARSRAATVIATMADSGSITPGEAAAADLNGLKFAPQERTSGVRYFTDYVLAQVENLTDEAVEPLSVATTLDPAGQRAAEAAIAAEAPAGHAGRARRRWRATARSRRWSAGATMSRRTTTAPSPPAASRGRRGSCSTISPRSRAGSSPTTPSSTRRSRSTAGRRRTSPPVSPAPSPSARRSRGRSTPSPSGWRSASASTPSPTSRAGSASPRRSTAARRCRSARPT